LAQTEKGGHADVVKTTFPDGRFVRSLLRKQRSVDRIAAMGIIEIAKRSTGRRAVPGISPSWFMGPAEIIYIDEMVAACNGGGGPLGHPRVYLNLAPGGRVECPYCSRLYVNRAMAGSAAQTAPTASSAINPPPDGSKTTTSR
jgi:uncharacterized Zn-finger protein